MGVKSTVYLTLREAMDKYAELKGKQMRRALMAEALCMERSELEDALMRLNDEVAGGEGFENYTVSDDLD